MDIYDLEDYYRWSIEPNSYSIVYKVEVRVWGVMNLEMREDHVYIAMLGRNVVAVGPVGSLLVRVAEDIARELGKPEVRLDSLDTAVIFYDEKCGYEEYADRFHEESFGVLTPKKKRLQPLPSLSSLSSS